MTAYCCECLKPAESFEQIYANGSVAWIVRCHGRTEKRVARMKHLDTMKAKFHNTPFDFRELYQVVGLEGLR